MRIISGTARGTKLYTLEGQATRPTLDRVKESLFNIIQNQIYNAVFLDLFSGSGAIGLEAASRGAKKVILCDKSKEAVQIIKKNTDKTHLIDKTEIYNLNYEDLINNKLIEHIDIVYIDPPYNSNYASKAVELLTNKNIIDNKTIIIIETDEEEKVIKELEKIKIEIKSTRKYGRAALIFLNYSI